MGTFGTFTGVVRWLDPSTQQGYVMALKDGEIQAAMIGDGLTAAAENILLDANGFILHDMSGASIITPTFGVGPIMNVLGTAGTNPTEKFSDWTTVGTASVTENSVMCPNGVEQVADTVNLPASGDTITMLTHASTSLVNGATGVCAVWLKGASTGTIRLTAATAGGTTLASSDVNVTTDWRRVWFTFTNTTGSAAQIRIGIKRNGAGQLAAVYAWGANVAFGFNLPLPYWPNRVFTPIASMGIRGPLYLSTANNTFSVIIGTDWPTAIPTGIGVVAIGDSAGDNETGDNCILIGQNAGASNSGIRIVAVGQEAGTSNPYNYVVLLGYRAAATGANQFVAGSSSGPMSNVFFGEGVVSASPTAYTLNGTGGAGTNIAGGGLKLAGGQGTGTGAGGAVVLQTAPAGSSGSSQNSLVDRLTVGEDGTIDFHNNPITNWSGPSGSGSVTRWRLSFGA